MPRLVNTIGRNQERILFKTFVLETKQQGEQTKAKKTLEFAPDPIALAY
jgi:hypothetical protein